MELSRILTPRAGDLHPTLATQNADEAADRALLPARGLDDLLPRGPALALEHGDDLRLALALARLASCPSCLPPRRRRKYGRHTFNAIS